MEDILYTYHGQLYVNLTNQCPCACTFCIRSQTRAIGSAQDLWLKHDPSVEEVKAELDRYDLSQFQEVVFCGYGEPICALDRLIAVADYTKMCSGSFNICTMKLLIFAHVISFPPSAVKSRYISTISANTSRQPTILVALANAAANPAHKYFFLAAA